MAEPFEPLVKALNDAKGDVRVSAAEALGKISEPAVEPLIRALNDANSDVRRALRGPWHDQ